MFYPTDSERDTGRLMDGVFTFSIESIAIVFGADLREGDIKPVS